MKIATCLLIFCLVATACSSRLSQQGEEQLTDVQFDSLRRVYYQLNDTLHYTWNSMWEDDNHKLRDLRLLLTELHKTDVYDQDSLKALAYRLDVLANLRYDSLSMKNPRLIRRYDSLTASVSELVISYVERLPTDKKNPALLVLTDQVISAQHTIPLYRLRYDRFIEDFNHFLEQYKHVLSRIDSSGGPVYKRPMFRLIDYPK